MFQLPFEPLLRLTEWIAKAQTFYVLTNVPTLVYRVESAIGNISTTSGRRSSSMKKLMLVAFAFTMLMSMLALAQDTGATDKQQSTATTEKMKTKAVALSGRVSDDGKMFVSDKGQTNWTVSNPDALKGHEGHEVTLKAHVDEAKNEIHVVSVKMGKVEKKETMK
jgi:hypothetical protein